LRTRQGLRWLERFIDERLPPLAEVARQISTGRASSRQLNIETATLARLRRSLRDSFRLVASGAVADFVRRAQIPRDDVQAMEEFLRTQEADSTNTLAVLERPDQSVALLKVTHAGEATLFSFLPGQQRVHESYIGRVYDAVITQVHAIENAADASALKPERVEIEGSRLAGTIDLTYFTAEERLALVDALRKTIASR
jgi:hypothetical protein